MGICHCCSGCQQIKSKIDSELLPKWKNNIKEVIKIPKGTELGFLIAIFTAIVPY
ncbi:hypothetical protein B4168_1793 [Anoxybacillus flavithermus]|nr:hypothetical protein B4168_1793 [Anoxybacillus flavithermus]OAO84729.1 hypothetical protein GT23_3334 [Parageobacillus thermoglucosidasius]